MARPISDQTQSPDVQAWASLARLPKPLKYRVMLRYASWREPEVRWMAHIGTAKTFGLVGATAYHADAMMALLGAVRMIERTIKPAGGCL